MKSPRFRRARQLAENYDRWFVISAKHGLIEPEKVIESYDETLKGKPVKERKAWAEKVLSNLYPFLNHGDVIVLLAGNYYREFIVPSLEKMDFQVEVPLRGVSGNGPQLNKLKEALDWVGEHGFSLDIWQKIADTRTQQNDDERSRH